MHEAHFLIVNIGKMILIRPIKTIILYVSMSLYAYNRQQGINKNVLPFYHHLMVEKDGIMF